MTNSPNSISAVIPALNEQETIAGVVVAALQCPLIDEVVVVNNKSTDETAMVATAAGARVIDENTPGQGNALRTGYREAKNDWVIKLDADLSSFSDHLVTSLHGEIRPGVGLIKGLWHDANDNMPMTRLMVRPAIAIMFPGLSHIQAVNSGIFLFNRALIAIDELTDDYGADLDIMLRIHTAGWNTVEVNIGDIAHNPRNLQHYNNMAETLLRFLIQRHEQGAQNSIVVVVNSAQDIIASSLGVLVKKLRSGGRATAYLRVYDDRTADLLKSTLVRYPTFSIKPLESVHNFSVLAGRQQTTILTSHFNHVADSDDSIVHTALDIQRRYNKLNAITTFLMMPVGTDGQVAREFRPDVRIDISKEVELKRQTQEELCQESAVAAELITGGLALHQVWRGQFNPETIEQFQAFDHKDISPPLLTL